MLFSGDAEQSIYCPGGPCIAVCPGVKLTGEYKTSTAEGFMRTVPACHHFNFMHDFQAYTDILKVEFFSGGPGLCNIHYILPQIPDLLFM